MRAHYLLGTALALGLAVSGPALAQDAPAEVKLPQALTGFTAPPINVAITPQTERGGTRIDYRAMDLILQDIVFNVGRSDRRVARKLDEQRTGTRIRQGSNSRYRHEGNRIVYHVLSDEYEAAISEYRAELERLPGAVPLDGLRAEEQLAYWLNLHNIVVIDELAKAYPIRRVGAHRIDGVPWEDAPIVQLPGETLSLNDIRFRKVAAQWGNPLVMYGFFTGEVGSPGIRTQAYDARVVWEQLDANAREFVNSLRGVEHHSQGFEVSAVYDEWRPYYFTDWPDDLRRHINPLAGLGAAQTFRSLGEPTFARYDDNIADLTNGGPRCGGLVQNVYAYGRASSTNALGVSTPAACNPMPVQAQELVNTVIERRMRRLDEDQLGTVRIIDLPTEDPDDDSIERVDVDGNPIGDS